ncbi:MAG: MazG family protein, partial [Limisphaerales bacterium]
EKLVKKARKAKLFESAGPRAVPTKGKLAEKLFELAALAQGKGWSAEELLRGEVKRRERALRKREAQRPAKS